MADEFEMSPASTVETGEPGTRRGTMILMGTGTSVGIPMIGCRCPVCRSTDPRNHRMRTGVLVRGPQGNFVIDTPPELRLQLVREQEDRVKAALYTHTHADHLYGLDDLRIFCFDRADPFPLYCDASSDQRIRQAFDYAFSEPYPNAHPGAVPQFRTERIDLAPFEIVGIPIVPLRLLHGRLEIRGYRMGSVAFCTDVSHVPDETLARLAGVDVLVLDALRDRPHPTHFSIDEALAVIAQVRPRQAYLTHISHSLDHALTNARLPPGVELAFDQLAIPFTF